MKRRTLLQATTLAAVPAVAAPAEMPPLDYGRSFLSGVAEFNRVRFWVESRTRVIDARRGKHEDYIQCASCKSEDTFAKRNLFYKDNYDFIPIFGPEIGVVFRRKASLNPNYRQVRTKSEMWGGQTYRLHEPKKAELLATNAAIRKATHDGWPLVAQTEIADEKSGLRAVLEFPVKTMNIHDGRDMYQVDTGPVALPDLSRRGERVVDSIALAFVAFNTPDFADFVIEDVTPILEQGREVTRIRHYSRIISLPAKNRLFACKG